MILAGSNVWDVTGGAEAGGIIVRKECDLNSEAYEKRLSTGAKIRELDLQGQRLHYSLLTGSGPAEGWISLANKGQPLVQRAARRPSLSLDRLLLRHESSGTFKENYEFLEDLGEGGFASVFVARNIINGQTRAIKKLQYRTQDELVAIDVECRTLVRLSHPHIMRFYEFYREQQYIYLVTELCTGGTFTQFFRDCEWDAEDARILFQQIISAIQHCHKLLVLHHDLKPENCLMLRDSGRPFAKVIDFGIATVLEKLEKPKSLESSMIPEDPFYPFTSDSQSFGRQVSAPADDLNFDHGFSRQVTAPAHLQVDYEDQITKITGSPFWRAPEVLNPNATSGPKADMYSIGLIMFYCFTGVQPLHRGSWLQPIGAKEDLKMYDEMPMKELALLKHDIPDEAQDLIRRLLQKDKHMRLSARDAMDHEWFDTSVLGRRYPEPPKQTLGHAVGNISYSCLSALGSDTSPGCSPKTSPKPSPGNSPTISPSISPAISPTMSPANSPRMSTRRPNRPCEAEEPILEEAPDQDTTPSPSCPVVYMCPAYHPLTSFATDEDGYSCSRCENEFPEASILYGCRLCDFDTCGECVKSLPVKKTIGSLLARRPLVSSPKRRVRLMTPIPKHTSIDQKTPSPNSPKSPKDTKFRQKRVRRGSVKCALLLDRVLRYKDLEPWHCAVLRLIAHNSHESDVAKLREHFFKMDTTKSGALSQEELKAAMNENGNVFSEDQLAGIFLNLDSQGTGEIEYHEWIASTLAPSITLQEPVMKMVFDFFDTNHRGCVGLNELKVLLGIDNARAMLGRAGVTEFDMGSFMKLMKTVAVT